MLINNYTCNINFTDIEMNKATQKFAMRLLSKIVDIRPTAKDALEDDIFCSGESAINLNLDFLDERYVTKGGPDAEPT